MKRSEHLQNRVIEQNQTDQGNNALIMDEMNAKMTED